MISSHRSRHWSQIATVPCPVTRRSRGAHVPQKLQLRPGEGRGSQLRARVTQPVQMYTPGPAISLATAFWARPQNEQRSSSPSIQVAPVSMPASYALVGAADLEHPAALGAVVAGEQLLVLEAAPHRDVDPGPGVVGEQLHHRPDLDRGDRPGQADHRDRAGQPQAVDDRGRGGHDFSRPTGAPLWGSPDPSAARSMAWVSSSAISRRSATAPGRTSSRRSTSASVASRRNDTRTEPWVIAPMAARTWDGSWVSAVQEDPEWTAMPLASRSSSSASPSMYRMLKATRWGRRVAGSPWTTTSGMASRPATRRADRAAMRSRSPGASATRAG